MRELLSRRLPVLVGRDEERSLISEAVTGAGRPVLLIIGDAGIGKTRLLEEVECIVDKLQKEGRDILCLPILDFYDTAMHPESAIEEAVVRSLMEHGVNRVFEKFREDLIECREGRISEDQLWKAFKQGYEEVCRDRHIVLRFDTAELLEYEHDDLEVLEDCEVEGLEAPALGWLAEKAPQLQNTVIIIASRPDEDLRKRLKDAYGDNLQLVELEKLTLEETGEYFRRAGDFGQQVLENSPETVEKVWLLSDGRPIFVSLSLDWLRRGMWDEKFYPVDVVELREMRKRGGGEWEEKKRSFGIALIRKIRDWDTLVDKGTYYAARARKGCNAEILAQMIEISKEEAEELVLQLRKLSFVKRPHVLPRWRKEWFFLHDEMYNLMEKHVWQAYWPDYAEQERIAGRIIEYYNDRIQQIERRIKEAEWAEKSVLQRQRQILLTESLYYQFDHNPRKGLVEYDRLDTQACSERAREWDNLLRIESLRFARQRPERAIYAGWVTIRDGKFQITDQVNMNCRARWVHRYVAHNEHRKAIEIATKLLEKYPDADLLWQARLLVSRAAAAERLGRLGENWLFDEAEGDIKRALELLDEVTLDEFNRWMVDYYKATAYIYGGLVARALGELRKASEAYEKAAALFESIGYQQGQARALNNRAYVVARQGKPSQALDDCEKGLQIRWDAGHEYGWALSLNTSGIITGISGDYLEALMKATQALRVFQRRRDEVGIALTNIVLGRAYRHWASSEMRMSPARIERFFNLSREHLMQAREKIKKLEPYYQTEAHNELGCACKDQANLLALHRRQDEGGWSKQYLSQYHDLMATADKEFGVADSIAGTTLTLEKADNLEDWAWAFHLRYAYRIRTGEKSPQMLFQAAKDKLEKAEETLKRFKMRRESGLEAHFILGKIHYQRAHLMKFDRQWEEVARNYALGATYLETFSREARELKEILLSIQSWLLGPLSEDQEDRFTADEVENWIEVIRGIVNEREKDGWKCMMLKGWIDVISATPSLGLGR